MIAIVFLLILLALAVFAASQGVAAALPIGEILMLIGMFVVFFGSGVYIAGVLGTLALVAGVLFSDRPFWLFMGQVIWAPSSSFVLVAVPLFLLMGEILLRSGLSEQLYKALNVWLRRLPGGLLHTNIASCAVFSAISGSSVATAATMGSVALPYFDKTTYNQRMVLGGRGLRGRVRHPSRLPYRLSYPCLTHPAVANTRSRRYRLDGFLAGRWRSVETGQDNADGTHSLRDVHRDAACCRRFAAVSRGVAASSGSRRRDPACTGGADV